MAYLNCPFCPSQSYLARDSEHSDRKPLEKYRCGSGKHVFYVEEEQLNENTRANTDDGSGDRTGACA
jgi:hypothetical protein